MKNNPITQRVKGKFAQLVQEPYLNVGKVQSGKKDSDCGCPGTPAKAYMSSAAKPSTVTKASLFGGKIAEALRLGMSEEKAKAYAIKEVQKAPKGVGKQTTGDVQVKDVPNIVADKASELAKGAFTKGKGLINKIGKIKLSDGEAKELRKKQKAERKALREEKKKETAAPKNYKKGYYGK